MDAKILRQLISFTEQFQSATKTLIIPSYLSKHVIFMKLEIKTSKIAWSSKKLSWKNIDFIQFLRLCENVDTQCFNSSRRVGTLWNCHLNCSGEQIVSILSIISDYPKWSWLTLRNCILYSFFKCQKTIINSNAITLQSNLYLWQCCWRNPTLDWCICKNSTQNKLSYRFHS